MQKFVFDSACEIQASRQLTLDAAKRIDQGDDARIEIGMIKVVGASMLHNVIDRAIQTELNGFIHWGDADWISRYEFALKIAESFNLKKDLIEPVKTAELKQTAIRPLKGGLSTIYAEKILNLEPPSIEHCLHQLKK